MSTAHNCPSRPHSHTTANAPVLVYDRTDASCWLTLAYGVEHGYGKVGSEKRDRCAVPAGEYPNSFAQALVEMGYSLSAPTVVLGASECLVVGIPADLDRFTNDSRTGRYEVYCGWCGERLAKVGYGPGLVIVCPTVVNGSGLTAHPEFARIRDDEGRKMLEAHALRLA